MSTRSGQERQPTLRVIWHDAITGRDGYLVIDRLVDGVAGGGTRVRAGLTLAEVERLAATMTYKCGAMNIAAGGAKGGIDCDPGDAAMPEMLGRFVSAMRPLLGSYWSTAEDFGISQAELDEVFAANGLGMPSFAALQQTADPPLARQRLQAGLSLSLDGASLADVIGGYGVAEATVAAMVHMGLRPQECSAVVQGVGSMGGSSARYLARHGVRIVGIVDALGGIVNDAGVDVERLLAARTVRGEVDRAALGRGDREIPRDEWLHIAADVIVPAAVPDAIREDNCDDIKANLVVEAANICTTDAARASLHDRGVVVIPDFVANAGTNSWWWWMLRGVITPDVDASLRAVRTAMRSTVGKLLDRSSSGELLPRQAAIAIAEENIATLAGEATDLGATAPGLSYGQ